MTPDPEEASARRAWDRAYLGLGANEGDRLGALQRAIEALKGTEGVRVIAASPVYETEAHTPGEAQPPYLNAVLAIETRLPPDALLAHLHRIEGEAGRRRTRRWAPRPLDLDVLLFGDRALQEPHLTIPHPGLALRRFVLAPLADLAPDAAVPGLGSVRDLLAACRDPHAIARTHHVLAV